MEGRKRLVAVQHRGPIREWDAFLQTKRIIIDDDGGSPEAQSRRIDTDDDLLYTHDHGQQNESIMHIMHFDFDFLCERIYFDFFSISPILSK